MEKFKAEEGTVQETLMMPLYGRAYCEEHFPNTFPNKAAKETAAKVDFDFSKVKSSELNMVTWGLRARMLQDALLMTAIYPICPPFRNPRMNFGICTGRPAKVNPDISVNGC